MRARRVVGFLEAVQVRDVWIIQRGQQVRFTIEPGEAVATAGERVGQDFQRHQAAERGIAGAIDLSHAARTQRRDDFVRAETRARRERHSR